MEEDIQQSKKPLRRAPPVRTSEARENQMIALAIDLAEKQIRNGTASSQVVSHFLKLGTSREKLEKEMLIMQKELIKAKTESIQSAKRVEELYLNALNAMKTYTGRKSEEDEYE